VDGAIMRRPSNQWQGDGCEMSNLATKRFGFGDVPQTEESREILHDVLVTVERLASIGGWTWDLVNDQLVWSQEVSRIFGRDLQSFPATVDNFISVVHPDDLQRVQAALAAIFDHDAPYDIAFRIVRPDRTERIIHAQGESILNQAGKVVRLTGTVHDITEREAAERLVRDELQRTQTQLEIIGQIGQSEALMSGDIEAIAAEITELAALATGCERVNVWLFNEAETELRCVDLYEATPARHSSGLMLSEDDFGEEFAVIKASRYVAADDPLTDPRTRGYVEPYLKPLGITSMLDAVVQASGRNFGLLCFEHVNKAHSWTRDEIAFACQLADKIGIAVVSLKRRQAEATTRTMERLAGIGSWEWDLVNDRMVWSDEVWRIFGRERQEFPPTFANFLPIVHPEDVQPIQDALAATVERQIPHDFEFRAYRPDGSERNVRSQGKITLDTAGRSVGVTGTTQDITERKAAEAALRQRDALLHAVAHSATEFVAASSLDEAMPKALELVSRTLQIDRMTVLERPDPSAAAAPTLRYVWQSPDAKFELDQTFFDNPEMMTPGVVAWQAPLFEGRIVLANLREPGGDVKRLLEGVDSKTLLLVPIRIDGKNWGEIGLESCTAERLWADFEIEILQTLGELIGNSIRRERYVEEIANANRIIQNSPTFLYRLRGEPSLPMLYVSQNITLFGHEPADLMASPHLYKTLIHPDDFTTFTESLAHVFDGGTQRGVSEFRLSTSRGDYRWVENQFTPIRDAAGRLIELEGLLIDVTERKAAEAKILHLARTDQLTGLANRATFMERLRQAFAASRRGASAFALLSLDIDRFKEINDTLGHPAGDQLLATVAERLRTSVRESDIVARLGGDEFAILQSELNDGSDAGALAGKIRDALAIPVTLSGNVVRITASVGIATYAPEIATPDDMLAQADVALYRAKEEGRDQYRFHTEELDDRVREQVAMTNDLAVALSRDEFALHYESQLELCTGKTIGMQAVLRWHHPTRGLLRPPAFHAIAERSGANATIGRWMIDRACKQMSLWRKAGNAPATVAVNISFAQIKNSDDFVRFVSETLAKWGLAPGELELDVTEYMLAQAAMTQNDVLERLQKLGVRISIDDFGTKCSTFDYLGTYRVNRIKISQPLIDAAMNDADSAATIQAIVAMASELHIDVIAQGQGTSSSAMPG
jgi:diguanylate cyclase (GGDEF)-like protein/PAS domain S-box-containing protein